MINFFYIIILLIPDILLKYFIINNFKNLNIIEIIPYFLNIVFVKNYGAIFGILSGYNFMFILISLMLILILLFNHLMLNNRWSLILILTGIFGNLIDRCFYGFVIDFIDIHIGGQLHYPSFNLSDCFICIGIAMLLFTKVCQNKTNKAKI